MPAKYKVSLTDDEKHQLEALVHRGKSAARSQTRARILLKAAAGVHDKDITHALDVSSSMVAKTRQRCAEEGPEAALKDRDRPGQTPKLTEEQVAHIIAIACSEAPEGHAHWTLRLLASKVVELSYASSCSHEMIRQLLKKHSETLSEAGMLYSRNQYGVRGIYKRT
ncbi:MAG TPA: helix-turn-helix domain-containing protein [Methylobacter sp.]|jgi:transposase